MLATLKSWYKSHFTWGERVVIGMLMISGLLYGAALTAIEVQVSTTGIEIVELSKWQYAMGPTAPRDVLEGLLAATEEQTKQFISLTNLQTDMLLKDALKNQQTILDHVDALANCRHCTSELEETSTPEATPPGGEPTP